MSKIDIVKMNPQGEETWRYSGNLLKKTADQILLEAFFEREDMDLHGLILAKGDRFVETYYTDRWYNIFEIHAREDDHLRGWYCNISSPAKLEQDTLFYTDLALDVLVFPDGSQLILDEDEFVSLDISPQVRLQAQNALAELQLEFKQRYR